MLLQGAHKEESETALLLMRRKFQWFGEEITQPQRCRLPAPGLAPWDPVTRDRTVGAGGPWEVLGSSSFHTQGALIHSATSRVLIKCLIQQGTKEAAKYRL